MSQLDESTFSTRGVKATKTTPSLNSPVPPHPKSPDPGPTPPDQNPQLRSRNIRRAPKPIPTGPNPEARQALLKVQKPFDRTWYPQVKLVQKRPLRHFNFIAVTPILSPPTKLAAARQLKVGEGLARLRCVLPPNTSEQQPHFLWNVKRLATPSLKLSPNEREFRKADPATVLTLSLPEEFVEQQLF